MCIFIDGNKKCKKQGASFKGFLGNLLPLWLCINLKLEGLAFYGLNLPNRAMD